MKKSMKITAIVFASMVGFVPLPLLAQQGCFADYKAKRSASGALELHYGVIQLDGGSCGNVSAVTRQIANRVGADNWILLRVLSTFDQSGLSQRKQNAGQYYLKY